MCLHPKKQDEYGTLLLNIVGAGKGAIVELLDNSGKVLRTQPVNEEGMSDFYYLNPNTKYYIRLFIDRNGNGMWDWKLYGRYPTGRNVLFPEDMGNASQFRI